jgi:hypothetical protein
MTETMKSVIENPDVQRTGQVDKQGRVFLGAAVSGEVVRVIAEIAHESDRVEDDDS